MWPFGCRGHDFGEYTPAIGSISGLADDAIEFEEGYLVKKDCGDVSFLPSPVRTYGVEIRATRAYRVRVKHMAVCQHDGCHTSDTEFRPVGHVTRESLLDVFDTPEELAERVWDDDD